MNNLNDFHYEATALDQRASGTITVDDYSVLSGKTVTVDGNVLTEGVDWNAATDNDTTATSLASAIDGIAGYSASATGAIVTIYYETPGTGGNAKTVATNAVSGLTLSGATLAGGVAATYTDKILVDQANECEQVQETTALTGTSPTVDITPQYSFDNGVSWHDDSFVFTQITSAPASEALDRSFNGTERRFKIVLGGTNPLWTGKIHAIPKT